MEENKRNLKNIGLVEGLRYIKNPIHKRKIWMNLISLKFKTFVLQKTYKEDEKNKLRTGRKYLQTTDLTKDSHLPCIKNPQNKQPI